MSKYEECKAIEELEAQIAKLQLELDIVKGVKVRVRDIDTRHEALLALGYEENSPEYQMSYNESDAARAISRSMEQILVAIFGDGAKRDISWITSAKVIETKKVKLMAESLEKLYHTGQASID